MREVAYNREKVLSYAKRWAMSRNPAYYNFEDLGGDCTNFASQCIFAGSGVMNFTRTFGWYYINLNNRSPSWTGVPYLYNFLVGNKGVGPYAEQTDKSNIMVGDIVQLGDSSGNFYHSPVVVGVQGEDIFVAAHTYDAFMRPLGSYFYDNVRYIHIKGVRAW